MMDSDKRLLDLTNNAKRMCFVQDDDNWEMASSVPDVIVKKLVVGNRVFKKLYVKKKVNFLSFDEDNKRSMLQLIKWVRIGTFEYVADEDADHLKMYMDPTCDTQICEAIKKFRGEYYAKQNS